MNKPVFSIVLFLFAVSCSAPKQATSPVIAKQTFTFDYTPKESAKLGSASMVLAFIRPVYVSNFSYSGNELFRRFKTGLSGDIEELLIAKGFSLKGPYEGREEMVFEDKKIIDMAVNIEISPEFSSIQGEWSSKYHVPINLLGASNPYYTYSYNGKVSLTGKINIAGFEPLTNEKIWAKSVSIPNVENIPITTENTYTARLTDAQLMEDPAVYNTIGKALKTQYDGIMDKIAAHFNVEELKSLQTQIRELKSKKGF
jgi:hypothetical protein